MTSDQINLLFLLALPLLGGLFFLIYLVRRLLGRRRHRTESKPADLLLDALQAQTAAERQANIDRQHKAQALDRLDALHQAMMEHLPVGVLVLNQKRRITYANPRARTLFGQDLDHAALLDIAPDIAVAVVEMMSLSLESRELDTIIAHQPRHLDLSLTELPDEEGLLLVVVDKTEEHRLAEQIRVRRDLSLMGEMAGGVAHEVKNSLATIQGRIQLLPYGDVAEHADKMMAEVTNLSDMVRHFMESSKDTPLEPTRVDVAAWSQHLTDYWEEHPHGRHVRVEAWKQSIILMADLDQLDAVVRNLVFNGLEACEPSPPESDVWVRLSFEVDAVNIRLIVEDQGPGLTDESRAKLFTPFVSSKPKGSGLGLIHARRIALAHGGGIAIAQGLPTRAVLTLPRGEHFLGT